MKKKCLFFITIVGIMLCIVGCGPKEPFHSVIKLNDYVYEVNTYEGLDYDFADRYFEKNYDNWGGGCSAVSTLIDGKRFVGRNMDLNISNKCAYIVKTKAQKEDELDTIGLAYTFRGVSPDYSKVESLGGISDEWYKLLPFMCDDVLNSEGLHIEINMRHAECYPNGDDKFSVKKTTNDPEARRIYMFEVPRYIGSHCKTVVEAQQMLINKLNIYNKDGYWNYAYIISDATGSALLVEIACNEIKFIPVDSNGNVMQTNFYRYEEWNQMEDTKSGIGRLDILRDNIQGVTSSRGLYNLMESINYFQYYSSDCSFDRRSELIGEIGFLTYDFIYNASQDTINEIMNNLFGHVASLTRQELRDENSFWETTFTEVVDCSDKVIKVKIFEQIQAEDPAPTYLIINFDETIKVSSEEELF